MNLKLSAFLGLKISFAVEITNARHVIEGLSAHRAGIHSQCAADLSRNSFHPFESAEICAARGIGNLFQLRADTRGDFAAVDIDLFEIAAGRVNDHSADSAIAH